jgi:hypothetical protein
VSNKIPPSYSGAIPKDTCAIYNAILLIHDIHFVKIIGSEKIEIWNGFFEIEIERR